MHKMHIFAGDNCQNMNPRALIPLVAALIISACNTPAEKAAKELAGRIVPGYRIGFRETPSERDFYRISPSGKGILIEGNSAGSMAAGLGRYLDDAGIDVSWYSSQAVEAPEEMPVPDSIVTSEAIVPKRFFLNYCTFGYSMPWWQWEEWERLIDWMALHGVNMPLAITGQEAVWQKVWRGYGLGDDEIRAYFTGPAHLPWHRMCNIDGVDGPLPQGWIDGQAKLQKRILKRERSLGMTPVLPAFAGHVPAQLAEQFPDAGITPVSLWGGFGEENRCWFLSPTDPLYARIQKDFLREQTKLFGTDHIYGFDLFNEVDSPSWDPETLAAIGREAYRSVSDVDPDAQWLQMGWMFHYDRKHWTPENVEAYLKAVPEGKVTILDYYTEHTPVWTITDKFYGQPYIFCYLGNFGGNTRLAGPFRKESARITDALTEGGARGIGCTLEGFGINRWIYEYVLSRAWNTGIGDDDWLSRLDRRHHSPDGFWKDMADSVYLRGSSSEGVLMCDRPSEEGFHSWRVTHRTPYEADVLERAFQRLLDHGGNSVIYRADVAEIGCQVLGNRFPALRDSFVSACREGRLSDARSIGDQMQDLLLRADNLASTHPQLRMDTWLRAAESWASSEEEKQYYRHNAWHLVTTWGYSERLCDYANRLWSGLTRGYYLPRWQLFFERMLDGSYDKESFNRDCWAMEQDIVEKAPIIQDDCLTLMTYNVGVFSKYKDSLQDVAELIREEGAGLVALNELDSCNRRHNTFQLELLAGALGYEGHFARAFDFAGGAYGNGVVSVEPVLECRRIDLPKLEGLEPRSVAVIETPSCVFASAHLDFKGSSHEQASIINNWFTEHYSGFSKPVFLCGDMNSVPGSDTIKELEKCWTRLSPDAVTYPAGSKCIDYVFAFKDAKPVEVVSTRVISDCTAGFSDHYPVVVTVRP